MFILMLNISPVGYQVSHLTAEKRQSSGAPGSDAAGSRDATTAPGSDAARSRDAAAAPGSRDPSTAACSAPLERVRSQLCPPAQPGPAGGAGCKLCPADWRLRRGKCYWVSTENKTWKKSRSDCTAKDSELLVIRDQEELEALQDLTQGPAQLWVGLSRPSPEKAWTWVNGSQLDESRFPVSGSAKGNSCGMLKGNQMQSQGCNSAHQGICQRDAVPL